MNKFSVEKVSIQLADLPDQRQVANVSPGYSTAHQENRTAHTFPTQSTV